MHEKSHGGSFRPIALVRRFLEPHPRLTALSDRLGARLFTALLLVHITVATIALLIANAMWIRLEGRSIWHDQDTWVVIAAIATHVVSLALIKVGHYRVGALSYLLVAAASGLVAPFVPDPNAEIGLVAVAFLPLILAAIAFTPRQVALLLAVIIGAGVFQIVHSQLGSRPRLTASVLLFLVAIGGGLLLVFRSHLNKLERLRTAELLESGRRYRDLFDNANEAILVAQDGKIVFFNPQFERFVEHPHETLQDRPFGEFVHPDDRALISERHDQRLRGGDPPRRYEFRILGRDGATRWVSINTMRMEWKGRAATLNFLTDVTERKDAEVEREKLQTQLNQAQKMESVGRLAGGVAHDFNNMLGAILGNADLALSDLGDSAPGAHELREIRKAAERSAELTRQLLAFARKQTIAPKLLDLNDTVEDMLKMLRRLIGEDISLLWAPGERVGHVNMDPSQIDQILANLCVNARDAIDNTGRITIETAAVTLDESYCAGQPGAAPGPYVLLAVSDDGCGMSKETLARVFEPFFTTKGLGKGTGLGLATIYGIVKQNAGLINVYSEPGNGTTFKIYLPVAERDARPAEAPIAKSAALRGNETILFVEDEPLLLEVGRRMLEGLGYRILPALGPREAIRISAEHGGEIQLLITDVVMPDMNGRDLASELFSLRPGLKCLFMSGYTANVIAHHSVLDEGVHFIAKPFSRERIAAKVRAVLDPA
jgi:PAS domain S-box-containing protein